MISIRVEPIYHSGISDIPPPKTSIFGIKWKQPVVCKRLQRFDRDAQFPGNIPKYPTLWFALLCSYSNFSWPNTARLSKKSIHPPQRGAMTPRFWMLPVFVLSLLGRREAVVILPIDRLLLLILLPSLQMSVPFPILLSAWPTFPRCL